MALRITEAKGVRESKGTFSVPPSGQQTGAYRRDVDVSQHQLEVDYNERILALEQLVPGSGMTNAFQIDVDKQAGPLSEVLGTA